MNTLIKIWRFLRYRFNLRDDQGETGEIAAEIERNVVFKGTNLWTLIFAILVASVGLNVNSTAVVIGAMLISPLMGPIVGLGLGVGTYNFELIKLAAKNLAIMVVVSLLTSTLYFWISPLKVEQSELLNRTTPAIWDVLIAFSGGLAGIVAATRKEKSNVVAGVAIATALMPPLCTVGYGLASAKWLYALGAFYLFSINAVFISFSTLLVVRILRFAVQDFVTPEMTRRIRRNVILVVVVTVVPSLFVAYNIVQRTIFEQRAEAFVDKIKREKHLMVIRTEKTYGREGRLIRLEALGDPVDSTELRELESRLPEFGLLNTRLLIEQFGEEKKDIDVSAIRFDILEDLYRRNEILLQEKTQAIDSLAGDLNRYRRLESESARIATELKAWLPTVQYFTVNSNLCFNYQSEQPDTIPVVYTRFARPLGRRDLARLYDWLKVRIDADTLIVIQN